MYSSRYFGYIWEIKNKAVKLLFFFLIQYNTTKIRIAFRSPKLFNKYLKKLMELKRLNQAVLKFYYYL